MQWLSLWLLRRQNHQWGTPARHHSHFHLAFSCEIGEQFVKELWLSSWDSTMISERLLAHNSPPLWLSLVKLVKNEWKNFGFHPWSAKDFVVVLILSLWICCAVFWGQKLWKDCVKSVGFKSTSIKMWKHYLVCLMPMKTMSLLLSCSSAHQRLTKEMRLWENLRQN